MITIGIITLFPEIFTPLNCSIFYKGLEKNYWQLNLIDLKKYGDHVDDTPYGGGDGMLIRADIISQAIDDHITEYDHIIFTVPFGKRLQQNIVKDLSQHSSILIVCGRYEGIDYRIYDYYSKKYNVSFISIGDYILAGGELPAMVISESILRYHLLRWTALNEESFNNNGYLEAPQYTRPLIWNNLSVPDVLRSGNHKNINQWKLQQSLQQTQKYRPDLIE
jgi:tRNA (guanine37-N1)-methyltransferase